MLAGLAYVAAGPRDLSLPMVPLCPVPERETVCVAWSGIPVEGGGCL